MAAKTSKNGRRKSPADSDARGGSLASLMIGDVEQLVQLMIDNGLTELDIADGQRKIMLKRGSTAATAEAVDSGSAAVVASAAPNLQPPAEEQADRFIEIKSPMVGTFYSASSPDVDNFVAVGDVVGTDDSVCLVEAMKVMNDIKAECAGTIIEICVKNAQPVEFGQTLFKVKPA